MSIADDIAWDNEFGQSFTKKEGEKKYYSKEEVIKLIESFSGIFSGVMNKEFLEKMTEEFVKKNLK